MSNGIETAAHFKNELNNLIKDICKMEYDCDLDEMDFLIYLRNEMNGFIDAIDVLQENNQDSERVLH